MTLLPHYFDTSKIDKVVMNLLANAIKFTPAGGKITMRAWDEKVPGYDQPVLKFSIEDTGIGIPPEKLPHIFERFMQVDASSTRAYGGMGIGLSLVKDFVELHGGTVDVKSVLGKGTKFIVSLPRGQEHFKVPTIEISEQDQTPKSLSRSAFIESMRDTPWDKIKDSCVSSEKINAPLVLIVEDNTEMRRALRDILKEDYRLAFASDGEEGVSQARKLKPDLILSDVMMPKKDGYGLIQELKSDAHLEIHEIPVILLTAKSGDENLTLGFQSGADDYISKPFSSKEVLARIHNLIRIREQKREIEKQAQEILNITSQVAHDIRSPLSSVQAVVENFKKISPQGIVDTDYLNLLELGTRRLKAIADELLTRYNHKKILGKEQIVFSLHRVLDEIVGEYFSVANKKGIKFIKKFDHAINCFGNPERIQRALGNIIKNAVESMNKAGEIILETEIGIEQAKLSIIDQGCGMSDETIQLILQGGHSQGKKEGWGIGMKIVREVMKEFGWRFQISSEVGKGTVFHTWFPHLDSKEGVGSFTLNLKSGETVVVIDDDSSACRQWELIASKKGFSVATFSSYEDFEKKGQNLQTKSAIVDYHFDNSLLKGTEIIQRLRNLNFDNLYLCSAEYWKPLIQEQARAINVSLCPKPIPHILTTHSDRSETGWYNVLVIDDDALIGLTWKALKQNLSIRELHYFPSLHDFLSSQTDPKTIDLAFVDLNLGKHTQVDGRAVVRILKEKGIQKVVVASGEIIKKEEIPEADMISQDKIPRNLTSFFVSRL